jgi:hypothetical protein
VSDQPIPNLTTIFQFKPDKVALLTTKDKSVQAARLERVISAKKIRVSTHEILPYDIGNVISVSDSLIDQCSSCNVSLNITGGTKIGTIGTFQTFFTRNKPIYYVNTRDNEIIRVYPEKESIPIDVSISMNDYLASYGFNVRSFLRNDSEIYKRRELTEGLAKIAIKNPAAIGFLNYNLPDEPEKESYPYKISIRNNHDIINLVRLMSEIGMGRLEGNSALVITDVLTAKYLKGQWFEEYVYMIAKSLDVDDVKLNVEGEWDVAGKIQVKNEFDVMIARKNRLFYISCKTVNPDRKTDDSGESVSKAFLYELDALGDRALGLFGKKLLASARPIKNSYVKKRAQAMNIKLVDGRSISTLKDNLKQWLSE